MNRRLKIAVLLLVLALLTLALVGMSAFGRAERATLRPALSASMSGEFAPTHLASLGIPSATIRSAPSIYVPSDHWRCTPFGSGVPQRISSSPRRVTA